MNELVPLAGVLLPRRNSLILIGLVLRTFSAIVADCATPLVVQEALPMRSPLKLPGPEVTLNLTLTLSPGATGPAIVFGASTLQPPGTATLSLTSVAGAPLVFVNVTFVS